MKNLKPTTNTYIRTCSGNLTLCIQLPYYHGPWLRFAYFLQRKMLHETRVIVRVIVCFKKENYLFSFYIQQLPEQLPGPESLLLYTKNIVFLAGAG